MNPIPHQGGVSTSTSGEAPGLPEPRSPGAGLPRRVPAPTGELPAPGPSAGCDPAGLAFSPPDEITLNRLLTGLRES